MLEKCLNVGKSVKSLGKVIKKRAQKLVGLLKSARKVGQKVTSQKVTGSQVRRSKVARLHESQGGNLEKLGKMGVNRGRRG